MDLEGKPRLGQVVVFTPEDAGCPTGVYRTATGHAASFIEKRGLDQIAADPASFGEYFSGLFGIVPTDHSVRHESSIQEDRAELRFREVARKARLIDDDEQSVVVPYGAGKEVIKAIKDRQTSRGQPRFTRRDLRGLQRFMVNVRGRDLLALRGAVKPLLPNLSVLVLEEACYHEHLGVLVDRQPTEDLCGV
jgi:CRISPR-associated endonuclease/helicase Cas3